MSLALVVAGKSSSESPRLRKQTKGKQIVVIDFLFLKVHSVPTAALWEPVAGKRGILAPAEGGQQHG